MATTNAAERPRTPLTIHIARRWTHDNLFSSRGNTILTVVSVSLIAFVLYQLLHFVLVGADWTVIEANRRLLALGRFPEGEEWRLWPPIWALGALIGATYGLWSRVTRTEGAAMLLVIAFLFGVLFEGTNSLLFAIAIGLGVVTYIVSQLWLRDTSREARARLLVISSWALLLPFAVTVLLVADGVRTTFWGGIFLNVMLATVGIVGGFPIGVLLALGRTSSLPVVRIPSTVYIEVVRAGPLIAWLFLARFVLLDFMPPIPGLDQLDIVIRAMIVLAGFTAAYVAEIVRGGLQSLAPGQREAASALGLNQFQIATLIVLPQALRAVIPALVSQFISLWKDTTLVFALGLTELLDAGSAAYSQFEFIGRQTEVLLFVGLLFWSISFSMSRISQRIETSLGIGQR